MFQGRHVAVTGATGELGRATALLLLSNGATVHLPVRSAEKAGAIFSPGPRLRIVGGIEATDEPAVRRFYDGLPGLWASVHCAGGYAAEPMTETTAAEYERLMAMNATSAFLCTREGLRRLRAEGAGGRIVNVAASSGLDPSRAGGKVAYAASKAAVAAMTQAASEEAWPDGILVNAVAPSILDTPANRRAMPEADPMAWPRVEDVAAVIAFLASPENAVIRGAVIPVYGRS